ncbi:MAG: cytochrome d ubiquinol oxidase subunit II [Calditrichia bacterium]|nr:cytochrome d ubiquinol oxidase subunit II [Calditrichia bacterium]
MEFYEILKITWYLLIGILFMAYSILDGFDLGIGVLFPFITKNKKEKRALIRSVGPVWDGNEVWLLTGAGALFASFPNAYATVFSGFYLALMLVLLALIFRAVSMEFWAEDEERGAFWEWAFTIGSFLPALLFGVALGNIIVGVPLDVDMEYAGSFFTLFRPFPLALGLLGLNAFMLQGGSYTILKTEGELRERTKKIIDKLWISFIVLFVLTAILAIICLPASSSNIFALLFALVIVAAWFMVKSSMDKSKEFFTFLMSSLMFVGFWGWVIAAHFPRLVLASNDSNLSLTLYNVSSSQLTLTVMLIIALIGVPIVIFYTIWLYKIFKGKVEID